jgi:hypothetical protein
VVSRDAGRVLQRFLVFRYPRRGGGEHAARRGLAIIGENENEKENDYANEIGSA